MDKESYFYTMQNKEILGGTFTIYQDDGRLVSAAKIAGNVEDEEILKLLENAEGFKKLVDKIGVSVLEESKNEKLKFVYQMYGNKEKGTSGTSIEKEMLADGREEIIDLADVNWSPYDEKPGQLRIEFANENRIALVTVRFFLKPGYKAPTQIKEEAVDFKAKAYEDMIKRSLMQKGNPARIKKAINKAREGKNVTVSFIGGSITQGAWAIPINTKCYAYKTFEGFKEKYGLKDNVQFVKAGVGGTPSELGMIRFDRDILRDGTIEPDIVVIEFAVNDSDDETCGNCYESLVRKVLSLPNKPGVILLFSVFSNDWNLQDRLSPIGRALDLPMVSIMDAVTKQFTLTKKEGNVVTKNQFYFDRFHPTSTGHKIMADCVLNLIEEIDKAEDARDMTDILLQEEPCIGKSFEKVRLLDRKDFYSKAVIKENSFEYTDTELQCVEMDDIITPKPQFPYNWMYDGEKNCSCPAFEMEIECKALLVVFKDSGSNKWGKADVYVDNNKVLTFNPLKNGWVHCNPVLILNEKESAKHSVRIQVEDKEKKLTILGFGYVE